MAVALPPPSSVLQAIRTSSEALTTASNITINSSAIDSFLLSLDQQAWEQTKTSGSHGIRLPLMFDSAEEELNIISTIALLNFLSGYRTPLHRLTSRGAFSTILSLILSAHLSSTSPTSSLLTTSGFLSSTLAALASLTRIQTHVEKDHPTLGSAVRVGEKDEEAWEVLELVDGVLKETGEVLKKQGKANLGEWVKEKLVETEGDAGRMVVLLAETFPSFRDAIEVDGQPVYLFKKALYLLTAISERFNPASFAEDSTYTTPASFPIPSTEGFPIFADNVIPSLLLHYNILSLSSSTDPLLSSLPSPPLLPQSTATRLRAASLHACSLIVSRAKSLSNEEGKEWLARMTEVDLDGWLWSQAKKGGLKDVERVGERGTTYY